MKKIWVKKFKSFEEADKFDRQYYQRMGAQKRLEVAQFLRELSFKLRKNLAENESRKRHRRVIRIIQ